MYTLHTQVYLVNILAHCLILVVKCARDHGLTFYVRFPRLVILLSLVGTLIEPAIFTFSETQYWKGVRIRNAPLVYVLQTPSTPLLVFDHTSMF